MSKSIPRTSSIGGGAPFLSVKVGGLSPPAFETGGAAPPISPPLQELMKEGASNCVERHLNLNDYDTSLLWTYSQVGHKCCFHSQRITPRAVRKRTYVYIRRGRVAIVNCDSRSQRWSRKGKARSKGSESGKPRRHIGLQKYLGYSRRSCEVRPCLAPHK